MIHTTAEHVEVPMTHHQPPPPRILHPDPRPTLTSLDSELDGRSLAYGVAGEGPPLVFLHGWGSSHRTYRQSLERLARNGARVFAPSLPGFGGTAELPRGERHPAGHARWLGRFIDSVGVDEPVTLVGHSFGGGVAIQTAHDLPDHVARLVLVNSIGGGVGPRAAENGHPIRAGLPHEWRATTGGGDQTLQLDRLAERGLPVTLLWARGDQVIPRAGLESLRTALRRPPVFTVAGSHEWPVGDPHGFGHAMRTVLAWPPRVAA
ncbi:MULTISPECIES: alpha/beta fold hydrolase [Rhodococcus]|uniref:alpha/beta fold hydrolase n=1 Tax=Rhodococcus TaxID=1827 RepID=UPI001B44B4D4|nr:alpha/beta fold hydrolase [Rhodococcus sp. PvR099]MBP1161784.1 pimeloyl-ACP methyl ester carboxylesterase [Rhodococcus sp. PvR099]